MVYIDREAFKRKLIDEKGFYPAIVARALEEMPDADVVEVVFCVNCIYKDGCKRKIQKVTKNGCTHTVFIDFCSIGAKMDGERRDA